MVVDGNGNLFTGAIESDVGRATALGCKRKSDLADIEINDCINNTISRYNYSCK